MVKKEVYMRGFSLRFLCAGLITVMLFCSGCASTRQAKRIEELQMQVSQLRQTIMQKDEQLQKSQDLLNEKDMQLQDMESTYQGSLEELKNELQKYKAQLENLK
jgi:septal ring factor EnvC (AmiA/AmiB activator)